MVGYTRRKVSMAVVANVNAFAAMTGVVAALIKIGLLVPSLTFDTEIYAAPGSPLRKSNTKPDK